MKYMEQIGYKSKQAAGKVGILEQCVRNEGLLEAAAELESQAGFLIEENGYCICKRKGDERILDRSSPFN